MPNHTATHQLVFTNVSFSGNPTFLHYFARAADTTGGTVFDLDNSGTANTGDYYISPSIAYSGYTVNLNGSIYAIYFRSLDDRAYIPHNGELSLDDIPSFGFLVESEANATVINCFARGTMITTPKGETSVEALQIGDLVSTADGQAVPVKWVGRQTIAKRFAGERAQLVRIAAGALGNHSDLFLTGDHGMVLDGCVVNASVLVNGGSIDWVPLDQTPERQTVYHIETAAHDVILANGAPSETFVDVRTRAKFDNFAEYRALYGDEQVIAETPLPRISSLRLLPPALRRRLVS